MIDGRLDNSFFVWLLVSLLTMMIYSKGAEDIRTLKRTEEKSEQSRKSEYYNGFTYIQPHN